MFSFCRNLSEYRLFLENLSIYIFKFSVDKTDLCRYLMYVWLAVLILIWISSFFIMFCRKLKIDIILLTFLINYYKILVVSYAVCLQLTPIIHILVYINILYINTLIQNTYFII